MRRTTYNICKICNAPKNLNTEAYCSAACKNKASEQYNATRKTVKEFIINNGMELLAEPRFIYDFERVIIKKMNLQNNKSTKYAIGSVINGLVVTRHINIYPPRKTNPNMSIIYLSGGEEKAMAMYRKKFNSFSNGIKACAIDNHRNRVEFINKVKLLYSSGMHAEQIAKKMKTTHGRIINAINEG